MKTNFFTIFLVTLLIVPFTSCKKDKDSDPGETLTGTWTIQRAETTYKLSEENEESVIRDYTTEASPSTITFTSDGRILVKDWDEDSETHIETTGTYEIIDGRIHASVNEEDFPFSEGFDYTITGNTLIITGTETVLLDVLEIEAEMSIKITLRR